MTNKRLGMMEKYHTSIHNSARVIYIRSGARVREKVSDIESQLLPSSLYPMLQISVFCEHFEITVLERLHCS